MWLNVYSNNKKSQVGLQPAPNEVAAEVGRVEENGHSNIQLDNSEELNKNPQNRESAELSQKRESAEQSVA